MNKNTSQAHDHSFGGAWTEIKLNVLREYLQFFTIALKKQNFKLAYIDAFAGTGSRTEVIPESELLDQDEIKRVHDGSARIALDLNPAFDRYLFIEMKKQHADQLEALKTEYEDQHEIRIRHGDANEILTEVCERSVWAKNKWRGVLFLDPYGNEVAWKTLEAIAKTQCLDVWFLFPISGAYRQAPHDPNKIDPSKRASLNKMFGTNQWETDFYKTEETMDLFGDTKTTERIHYQEIETWVKQRLEVIFKTVCKPLPLPSTGPQMFSLFCCISNPDGKAIGLAMKAANYILKKHGQDIDPKAH